MKLCFVVDFRSVIARNWIQYFAAQGHEIHVVSTYPFDAPAFDVASVHVNPVGFTSVVTSPRAQRFLSVNQRTAAPARSKTARPGRWSALSGRMHRVGVEALAWVTPLEARLRRRRLAEHIATLRPDLVHAMRIPYEGIIAAEALMDVAVPLVISVWGNDFTLWASKNPSIADGTRRAMRRADGLHTDCFRDRALAETWGWDRQRPSVVLPGSGGVQLDLFRAGRASAEVRQRWGIPEGRPVIINPRSFRPSYVRNDTFFAALPAIRERFPDVIVLGVAMRGHPVAEGWRRTLGDDTLRLLPGVSRPEMAELFQLADVMVSPSTHDGTPNSLLESMACGAFPVAGDIESVREWISHGENGLLFDPADPAALERALTRALEDPALRASAARRNRALVESRAEYTSVMHEARAFYERVTSRGASADLERSLTGAH